MQWKDWLVSNTNNNWSAHFRGTVSRCELYGKQTVYGFCLGCDKLKFVTIPEANGSFATYHEDPMCKLYIDECAKAKTIGLNEAVVGKDIKVG